MELKGLRTVIYPTANLDAARAWWSGFLGMDPYFVEPFYVGFEVAGYELGLVPDEEDVGDGAHVYWGVDDVAAAVKEAQDAGATVRAEPTDVGGGIVVALMENPDGGLFGLIYNPNFTG